MVKPALVAAKLAEIEDRVQRIRARCPTSSADFDHDRDALDLVSFNLMLAVQCAADIASHLIADEGWPSAKSLAQSFERLHERGVISATTAKALKQATGLRNIVAHGYGGVDPAAIHRAATEGITDLSRFAQELAAWLAKA